MLMVFRVFQGIGFGAEWGVGAVLVAELVRPESRGKALGVIQSAWAVGWALAVVAYLIAFELFAETTAWRVLMCLGILPALLILYVRSQRRGPGGLPETQAEREERSDELPLKQILRGKLLKTTIAASLLATGIQGGYYAMFTWIPTYLKTERDLTVVGTRGYLFVVIAGAFLGYLSAGFVHDRLGRRKTFALFAALAGAVAGRCTSSCRRARTRRCCSSASRSASSPRAASRASAPTCPSCTRRGRAGPAGASVTTSAAASGRCSRASSASSRRPSGSAARSPSACSATCSRSARWPRCRRRTAGSSRRSSDASSPTRCAGARAYDLEQPRYAGAPVWPAHEPGVLLTLHRRHEAGLGEARTSASALLVMTEHSGTHIDALCHQAEDLRAARRRRGRRAGADARRASPRWAPTRSRRCVARGVLLDVAGAGPSARRRR